MPIDRRRPSRRHVLLGAASAAGAALLSSDGSACPSGTESPDQTSITTVGPTINASPTSGSPGFGNLLAITSGAQISLNGATLGGGGVVRLYYINHTAYQFNGTSWYGPIVSSGTGALVGNPVPTITGITLSGSSFLGGSGTGTTVGTIGVTVINTTWSGSLSLSGSDAAKFQIVGTTLETLGTIAAGSYNINIVATQAGLDSSPFTQAEAITGTSAGGVTITGVNLGNAWFWGESNQGGAANGAPSGTLVGAINVATTGGAFTGTLALSGGSSAQFQIASGVLATNGTVNIGSYNFNVVATQAGATGSPFTKGVTVTGMGSICLNDESPYNFPLPASPTLYSNSAALVSTLTGWGTFQTLSVGNYGFDVPIYKAAATDPLYTIAATAGDQRGQQINGTQIRLPSGATASTGTDHHLVVLQPDGWVYDFWSVTSLAGNTITCGGSGSAGRIRQRGDGFGNPNAVAAKTPPSSGLVSCAELQAGVINHAIAIVVKTTNSALPYVWPGYGAAATSSGSTLPSCGTWYQLNMTPAQVVALGFPAWKQAMVMSMAVYGFFVDDTGAGTSSFIRFVDDASEHSVGGGTPLATWTSGQSGWSGNPESANIATGVNWAANLRVIDPSYLQTLYLNRIAYKKLDPLADVSNNWGLTGGASASSCLTQATYYGPFRPVTTQSIHSATNGQVAEVRCETLTTTRTATAYTGWFYATTAASASFRCDLESGTTVIATYTMPANFQAGWYGLSTGVADVSAVNVADIRLKFTMLSSATATIYAAHVFPDW